MGCCYSSPNDRNLNGSIANSNGPTSRKTSKIHSVYQATGEELVEMLKYYMEEHDYDSIMKLIVLDQEILAESNSLLENTKIIPPTIGCLALGVLKEAIDEYEAFLLNLSEIHAKNLVSCLYFFPKSMFAMSYIYNIAASDRSKYLRKVLVQEGVFQVIIPTMDNESPKIRKLATATCAVLYSYYPKLQREFIDCKGGWHLIQLLEKATHSDQDIEMILDALLELVQVKYRQDEDEAPVAHNIQRLLNSSVKDILCNSNLSEVSDR